MGREDIFGVIILEVVKWPLVMCLIAKVFHILLSKALKFNLKTMHFGVIT